MRSRVPGHLEFPIPLVRGEKIFVGPERGQVRVLSADGALRGAGVLVSPKGVAPHVLTCAHVASAALAVPPGALVVDLPGRDWSASARTVPGGWSPAPPLGDLGPGAASADSADLAVLTLDAHHPPLPRGCGPLPLGPCGCPDGRRVVVIGYPRGAPAGLIATARLAGRGGPCPEWVQLDGFRCTGPVMERGFSGAAVWDTHRRRAIGLITAAHTDRTVKAAWMLPVEAAVRLWPALAGAVRQPAARQCTPPTTEQQYRLADALLDVPQISYDSGRALRDALPPAVRRGIRDHAWPRQQLQAVVQACTDHRDGCSALRAAVLVLGGDAVSALTAVEILDRVCCAGGPAAGNDA